MVDGDLVFVGGGGPGQSLLGIDKRNGKVVRKGQDERITHSTPLVATISGRRQVIFFLQSGAVRVGRRWPSPVALLLPFPCFDGHFARGFRRRCLLFGGLRRWRRGLPIVRHGEKFAAKELWRITGSKQVACHWSTPVAKDGYFYWDVQLQEIRDRPAEVREACHGQDPMGASRLRRRQCDPRWRDKLLALSDDGQLVVVAAAPKAYKELARAKVLTGKCWSTPALADGRIYVRSTKEVPALMRRISFSSEKAQSHHRWCGSCTAAPATWRWQCNCHPNRIAFSNKAEHRKAVRGR